MNILALDTCTESCSAALYFKEHLYSDIELTQRGHSDLILGMMSALFDKAGAKISDVDAVAFGRGPGSFTGVRVGVGVAQGIAFARDLPVIPVSTLASLAQIAADTHQAHTIAVAIDAKMGEIYCAHYQNVNGTITLLDEEKVCRPEDFKPINNESYFGIGTGWAVFPEELHHNFTSLAGVNATALPTAESMLKLAQKEVELGNLLPAEQAMPVYLRNNVAKKKAEQGA
jgi:tRNA threonylcarbamoyladenosine biosynthesis protein TsaB